MDGSDSIINFEKTVNYWLSSSDDDYRVMMDLYKSKNYNWALFLGHISVEKLLKAYYVKKHQNHAPFSHDLFRLAELCELEISEEYANWLDKITSFNINARYEDYKREFYSLCSVSYTEEWITKINTLQKWIKQML